MVLVFGLLHSHPGINQAGSCFASELIQGQPRSQLPFPMPGHMIPTKANRRGGNSTRLFSFVCFIFLELLLETNSGGISYTSFKEP